MALRVLWLADNPTLPSLSAEASRKVTRWLAQQGVTVFYLGFHRTLPPSVCDGVTLLPSFPCSFDTRAAAGWGGLRALAYVLDTVQPDVVVTCAPADGLEDLRELHRLRRLGVPWRHWPLAGKAAKGPYEIVSLPCPVDDAFHRLRERRAGDEVVAGCVARNLLRRRLPRVLRKLAQRHWRVLWIEDPHSREVERFAAVAGLRSHRVMWNDVTEDAADLDVDLLNEYYNAMDVLVSWAEPGEVDLAALEAETVGTPVLRVDELDRTPQPIEPNPQYRIERVGAAWLKVLQDAATPPPEPPPGVRINWYGTLFGASSVNLCAREMVLALERCGAQVTVEQPFDRDESRVFTQDGFEADFARANPSEYAVLRRAITRRPHDRDETTIYFVLSSQRQYHFVRSAGRTRIDYFNSPSPGLTGEGPRLFVCSEHVREMVAAWRSDLHAEVVYHGVDANVFHPSVSPVDVGAAGRFVFLNASFPWHDKGLDLLCQAFAEEFAGERGVLLVLKLPSPQRVDMPVEFEDLARWLEAARAHPGCPEIKVYEDDTPARGDMARWYAAANAYVHPCRCETFGLATLEAAAVGVPLILTRWGGPREYCAEEHAFYVDCTPCGSRAEPDLASLRRQMRYVFTHPDEALGRAHRLSTHVRTHFAWDHAARRMMALLAPSGGDGNDRPA